MAKITLGSLGKNTGFSFARVGDTNFMDFDYNTKPVTTGVRIYQDSKNYTEIKGTGLDYTIKYGEIYGIKTGTITGVTHVEGGKVLFSATDLKVSARALSDALNDATPTRGIALLLSGNDTITGTQYADSILGGAGNDTLIGGVGADRLDGGAGSDTASYAGAMKGVVANLANASVNTNDAKGDTYVSIENLTGSSYADKLTGNTAANVLVGGNGNDVLSGNAGNDRLHGGAGADKLYGGAGKDVFVFKTIGESTVNVAGRDSIFDFSRTDGDKIDLSAIDANTRLANDQAFTFIGNKAFTKVAGQLRYEKQGADTYIYGDVDGNGTKDFAIHIDKALNLIGSDFLL